MSSKKDALRSSADQVASACYVVRLRAFNRLISRIYNASLLVGELTVSQFNILTAIVKREPVAPGQICSILHIEKSTLSRNIELMRKKGWIRSQNDGRTVHISVTDKGKHVYKKAIPFWEQAQRKARELAGEKIFQQIAATMQSLRKK